MSQQPTANPYSSNLSPLSQADVLQSLARVAQTVASLGDVALSPTGSMMKEIGGNATFIVNIIQNHLKNKKDTESPVSDIEQSISTICAEAEFLSPSTSPQFYEAIEEFKLSLHKLQESLEKSQSRLPRKRDTLKRLFQSDLVRETLLVYATDFRKSRRALEASHSAEVQHRVDALRETKLLAKHLQPISREVRNAALAEPCMDGTRIEVLDAISTWVEDPDAKNIFWINGGPGAGKSAIAASVVKMLQDTQNLGSFYVFRHGHAKLADPCIAWHTVVHDLIQAPPSSCHGQFHSGLRQKILTYLEDGWFDVDHMNLVEQFRALIQRPAYMLASFQCPVVVIDGLDECGPGPDQLAQMLMTLYMLPGHFKVVVTGRNSPDIEKVLLPISVVFTLTSGVGATPAALADAGHFLKAELPWAAPSVWEKLQEQAAGWFLWAKMAAMFLNEHHNKNHLVETLLSSSATGDINALYSTVLSENCEECTPVELENIKQVLSILVLAKTPLDRWSILQFSGISAEALDNILKKLKPVLDQRDIPTIFHLSFVEYILDTKYSGKFHIDANVYEERFAGKCLEVMIEQLKFNIADLPTSFKANQDMDNINELIKSNISMTLDYACQFWTVHMKRSTEITAEMSQNMDDLFYIHFLHWLEVSSLIQSVESIIPSLLTVIECVSSDKKLVPFVEDCIKFVEIFKPAIQTSVPHIYLSGVGLAPRNTMFSQQYYKRFSGLIPMIGGPVQWPELIHRNTNGVSPTTNPSNNECITSDTAIANDDASHKGHSDSVQSVVYSPDGKHIASASDDSSVRVWDAATGDEIALFQGHSGGVLAVAYSPDGKYIASGSRDKSVKVWDVATGSEVLLFQEHGEFVQSVVFSPNGKHIASGSWDQTVRVWNAITGHEVAFLQGHNNSVLSLAYSPDGKCIASGSNDKSVKIWDVTTGNEITSLKGHSGAIMSVAYSSDGKHIVSGSWDKTMKVWDTSTGSEVFSVTGHYDAVFSVAYSPNDKYIVSGSLDRSVRVWDAITGNEIASLWGHGDAVYSVSYSPDGKFIVSGSGDKSVRVWDESGYKNHKICSPTLVLQPDSWVHTAESYTDLLLWIPPFLPILHVVPQIIISQSFQVDVIPEDMTQGSNWSSIASSTPQLSNM